MDIKLEEVKKKRKRKSSSSSSSKESAPINNLDDGCLMHIFSFLFPIPDRSVIDLSEPGVFPSIETAVAAARRGDTILIAAAGKHLASNIQIKNLLCLIGGGELPDETTLVCSRGSDSALEFLSTSKLANLTVKAELGCCLLHRSGRLTIDDCLLQCKSNPLDVLSCPITSTASGQVFSSTVKKYHKDGVSVSRT